MDAEFCCSDASAFSLGFAASHGGTLILESSENVLSDYVNTVRPCIISKPHTDAGRAFAEYLINAGCVSDEGILDSPSLAPAAAEYALKMNLNVLLGAKIISRENDRVLIYTNSGLQEIACKKIICAPEVKSDSKILNCIVSGTDPETLSEFERFGGRIRRSFEKGEFIVSLPFDPACRLNEARIEFVNKIKACFGASVQIDAFAADFEYSNGFDGIIEEFEAGAEYDLL